MSQIVNDFLEKMKAKCISKSKEMAGLELSIWDNKHEKALGEDFGFNSKEIEKRKIALTQECS